MLQKIEKNYRSVFISTLIIFLISLSQLSSFFLIIYLRLSKKAKIFIKVLSEMNFCGSIFNIKFYKN